ncbi:hypothetical protein [Cylindrospermopsis raciborskii]|uniref:hypothetical protein n=1 Tax=Cylindrospermopsis raciborskii TaxID=77022 RepID=UPI00210A6066|nr:hypothetical protein [Cylindrospermopsis raciborskii]
MSTGAVKVEQHTQQVKRRITFAVQLRYKIVSPVLNVGLGPPSGTRLRFAKELNTVR